MVTEGRDCERCGHRRSVWLSLGVNRLTSGDTTVPLGPGWSMSCVLHTNGDGYVETTSGRVYLATTS